MTGALTGTLGLVILVLAALAAITADVARQWLRPVGPALSRRRARVWVRGVSLLALLLAALAAVATFLRLFALT